MRPAEILIRGKRDPEKHFRIELAASGSSAQSSEATKRFDEWHPEVKQLRINPLNIGLEKSIGHGVQLDTHMQFIASTMDALRDEDEDTLEAIKDEIHKAVPTIEKISLRGSGAGIKDVLLKWQHGPELSIDKASAGTRMLIGLFTFLHTNPDLKLVCIEEPENGLFPRALRQVLRQIRRIAANGGPQFLITTHSSDVITAFEDARDSVVLLKPDASGASKAMKASDMSLDEATDAMDEMGQLQREQNFREMVWAEWGYEPGETRPE